MGKSLKNSVSPEEIYDAYGADTLRLHLMATGPLDASRPWETRDVVGMYRFLQRLWRNVVDEDDRRARRVDRGAGRRRHPAQAAPDHRHRAHRDRGAALQHRHRQADRAEQPPHQDDGGGTPREVADALVLMVSPFVPHARRGAVAAHRPRHAPSPSSRSRRPTRRCSSSTRSSTRCRSTARCAATSPCPPTPTPPPSRRPRWPRPGGRRSVGGATPKKVIVVPGRMVNVVVVNPFWH